MVAVVVFVFSWIEGYASHYNYYILVRIIYHFLLFHWLQSKGYVIHHCALYSISEVKRSLFLWACSGRGRLYLIVFFCAKSHVHDILSSSLKSLSVIGCWMQFALQRCFDFWHPYQRDCCYQRWWLLRLYGCLWTFALMLHLLMGQCFCFESQSCR